MERQKKAAAKERADREAQERWLLEQVEAFRKDLSLQVETGVKQAANGGAYTYIFAASLDGDSNSNRAYDRAIDRICRELHSKRFQASVKIVDTAANADWPGNTHSVTLTVQW